MDTFAQRQHIIIEQTEMLRQEVRKKGITLENADSFPALEGWMGDFSAAMVAAIWAQNPTPTFETTMIPTDYETQLKTIIQYVQSIGE